MADLPIRDVLLAHMHEQQILDSHISLMVRLIAGKLRHGCENQPTWQISGPLADLKRELEDFNIKTGKWRKR